MSKGWGRFKAAAEMRAKAAAIRNWYMANGAWEHLTQTEARHRAESVIGAGGTFRRASVDEELDLDGI